MAMNKGTKVVEDDGTKLRPAVLVPTLMGLFKARQNVLLKGHPGVGKTDMVKQAAEGIGFDLSISHPVTADPTDYKGMPAILKTGRAEFLPFGDLRKLMEATRPMVFFLDDLGQAAPSVQAAAMQLLLAREINGQKISDHVTFAAATNYKSDKAGVSGILEPVKSRFATILGVAPSADDWVQWARGNRMPGELIGYILWRPGSLMAFEPTADIVNTPSPRTVAQLGRLLSLSNQAGEKDDAKIPADGLYAMMEGAVGRGFATEFMAYLRVFASLPDPDQVLNNPQAFKKLLSDPSKPDVTAAICVALGDRVSIAQMPKLLEVSECLPSHDFLVLMLSVIKSRGPEYVQTKTYREFIIKHTNMMV